MFASAATNLVAGDDATKDVYRKDLQTGAVTLVSVNTAGQKANAAVFGDPDVSYDGRAVSFGSGDATNLFAGDLNNASDIVVRDIAAGDHRRWPPRARPASWPTAPPSGRRSAPTATSWPSRRRRGPSTCSPGDVLKQGNDIVVRNLAAGTTAGASDPTAATGSGFPDISGDGRYVVFETGFAYDAAERRLRRQRRLPPRHDRRGAIALASAVNGSATGSAGGGVRPAISADGARVAFTSLGSDLAGADANAANDVYVRDPASLADPPGERAGGRHHRQQHRLRAQRDRRQRRARRVRPQRRGRAPPSWSPTDANTAARRVREGVRADATRRRPRWRSRGRRGPPPTRPGSAR